MVESRAEIDGKTVAVIGVKTLLAEVSPQTADKTDTYVRGVAYRADSVAQGDVFFCVRGTVHDGHDFARQAVSRGAVALVAERPLPGLEIPQYLVPDSRIALARAAAAFWQHPSASMKVFGITGTNGKTTTTYLLDAILRAAGEKTGVIGTVETRIGDTRLPATRTTPESSDLQALLARMRDDGITSVAMEVSSHAIDLHRVDAVVFAAVGLTNLTQDHLDYHHTMGEYAAVKRRLFTDFSVGARVIDVDDPFGAQLGEEFDGALTVGRHESASVRAIDELRFATGTEFTLVTPHGSARMLLPLAGAYNVSNALMAAGCALSIGIPLATVVAGLESAPQVPGRLERVDAGQQFSVLVDYAHTPDSLEKAIIAVKRVTKGRTIVVFGCGGDRDPAKRSLMGAVAGEHADISLVTSDNPRSEDPLAIIAQVELGLKGSSAWYEVEVDRRCAIARAIGMALPDDSVLIAGKGHEDYQIFADKTVHFDDREVAREELDARC